MNSVLLKYINVYKYLVLYKLLLSQNQNPFFEEDYIIVEETIKFDNKKIKKNNNEKIEDEWTEINFHDYLK
jgi:hypothetical protein